MKIIPLGTNGFFSSFGRETACYAIPYKNTLIILDAGSGLFRLAEPKGKKLLEEVEEIHLFLSHYHLDHTIGLYAAFKFFEGKKVKVFGPSRRKVFSEFSKLGYFPVDYEKEHANFTWENLKEGKNKISDYSVFVRGQDHRGEVSLAFRFSFGLAYVTDGLPSSEGIKFISNMPILLHEAWFSGDSDILDGHATVTGAAKIAKKAKVGKLVLIHHNPFADKKKLVSQLKLARSIFPKTELAEDLKEVSF